MSFDSGKYDNVLLDILQNEGQIQPFLEAIFSFLYRRTDFYRIQNERNLSLGFPPGVAKNILLQVFTKYYSQARLDDEHREELVVPDVEKEVVLPNRMNQDRQFMRAKRRGKQAESDGDSYNGANLEKYSWSQNQSELDVRVKVSSDIMSGKNVKVDVKPDRLVVSILKLKEDGRSTWTVQLEGTFPHRVKTDPLWSLVPGDHVLIPLEKHEERLWEYLLEGEAKLDTRQMDNTVALESLDEDSQTVVQELVYNQNQKMAGKLTSKEQKMEKILKEAWDMEGSPFKGQPFDMSRINVANSEGLSRDC